MQKIRKIYKFLLLLFPAALYFSYFPVITLGHDETMNFELSIPLIWLVLFDIVALILMGLQKKLVLFGQKWKYLLFPVFASLSIIWSDNVLRGVLTAGIMWALYIAVFAILVLRDEVMNSGFRQKMLKIFLGASLIVCIWCFVQCILDIVGVGRECSLLCQGCVSLMFGFPHPNGFAIEPQFMGNLLIAPTIVTGWLILKYNTSNLVRERSKLLVLYFMIFTVTLFLTFSRGAIYAFGVGMVFLTAFILVKAKKSGWGKVWKKVGLVWGMIILSFAFTLNAQGVMAELGPTNDTYKSAIVKALNHLSLGIIDLREKINETPVDVDAPVAIASTEMVSSETTESADDVVAKENAIFDGYVTESTEERKKMTSNALSVWSSSFGNVMFGVGLGGAGRAMQEAGLIDNANEIVQNQYVSVLLETGLVGIVFLVILLVFVLKLVIRLPINSLLLTLFVAYGVSLFFFAGLPNALHIYLMPVIVFAMLDNKDECDTIKVIKNK
ncbi:O-antigen ligase family protein [Candidatus Saccharibacteria bacterium]|nr:O-antigen ligase family protein [Candidatus Saccharibacteria bacterium]